MSTILIIDDNFENLENEQELLELSGYQVIPANCGRTGIQAALQNQPDLILCDIMMYDLDGYTVLTQVRQNPMLHDTPFIFLTATLQTDRLDLKTDTDLKADDYILKPFDETSLIDIIELHLAKSKGKF